jgi:hypothetical protein
MVNGISIVIQIGLFWLIVIVHRFSRLLLTSVRFANNWGIAWPLRVLNILALVGHWDLIIHFILRLKLRVYKLLLPDVHSSVINLRVYLVCSLVLSFFISLALVASMRSIALPRGYSDLVYLCLRVIIILQYVRIIWFLLVFHSGVPRGLSLRLIYNFCLFVRRVYSLVLAVVDALLAIQNERCLRLW